MRWKAWNTRQAVWKKIGKSINTLASNAWKATRGRAIWWNIKKYFAARTNNSVVHIAVFVHTRNLIWKSTSVVCIATTPIESSESIVWTKHRRKSNGTKRNIARRLCFSSSISMLNREIEEAGSKGIEEQICKLIDAKRFVCKLLSYCDL